MTVTINGTSGITTPGINNSSTLTQTGAVTASNTASFATTISVGAATPASTGAGVTFPASQSASSDANTLDDYEEGTWTPVVVSSGGGSPTYTAQAGWYRKVGSLVVCGFYVSGTKNTLAAGDVTVTGLPFSNSWSRATENSLDWYVPGGTAFVNGLVRITNGSAIISFHVITAANVDATAASLTVGNISTSFALSSTISYQA